MSQESEFDIFDPTGLLKTMRDHHMDAWAKSMVQFVNSDAYSDATGRMLDAWLNSIAPFRKLFEVTMNQSLTSLNMPTRDEIIQLAERLTSVEMRMDDLDAKLDEFLQTTQPATSGRKNKSVHSEKT